MDTSRVRLLSGRGKREVLADFDGELEKIMLRLLAFLLLVFATAPAGSLST